MTHSLLTEPLLRPLARSAAQYINNRFRCSCMRYAAMAQAFAGLSWSTDRETAEPS